MIHLSCRRYELSIWHESYSHMHWRETATELMKSKPHQYLCCFRQQLPPTSMRAVPTVDMVGCASSFDGRSIHVPAALCTLRKMNILRQLHFHAYRELLTSPLTTGTHDLYTYRRYGTLLNGGAISFRSSLRDAEKVIKLLRTTVSRMIKYTERGFTVTVVFQTPLGFQVLPFPLPFLVLYLDIAHKLHNIRCLRTGSPMTLTIPHHVSQSVVDMHLLRPFIESHLEVFAFYEKVADPAMALSFLAYYLDFYDQILLTSLEQSILFSYFSLRHAFILLPPAPTATRFLFQLKRTWLDCFNSIPADTATLQLDLITPFIDWHWLMSP